MLAGRPRDYYWHCNLRLKVLSGLRWKHQTFFLFYFNESHSHHNGHILFIHVLTVSVGNTRRLSSFVADFLLVSGVQNNVIIRHLYHTQHGHPKKSTTHRTPDIAIRILLTLLPMMRTHPWDYCFLIRVYI